MQTSSENNFEETKCRREIRITLDPIRDSFQQKQVHANIIAYIPPKILCARFERQARLLTKVQKSPVLKYYRNL